MATGDKLVNLDVLKNTVQKEVVDLKSAINMMANGSIELPISSATKSSRYIYSDGKWLTATGGNATKSSVLPIPDGAENLTVVCPSGLSTIIAFLKSYTGTEPDNTTADFATHYTLRINIDAGATVTYQMYGDEKYIYVLRNATAGTEKTPSSITAYYKVLRSTDTTLSVSGTAADAKATGDVANGDYYPTKGNIVPSYTNYQSGKYGYATGANQSISYGTNSDYGALIIPVKESTHYTCDKLRYLTLLDSNMKSQAASEENVYGFDTTTGTKYICATFFTSLNTKDNLVISSGTVLDPSEMKHDIPWLYQPLGKPVSDLQDNVYRKYPFGERYTGDDQSKVLGEVNSIKKNKVINFSCDFTTVGTIHLKLQTGSGTVENDFAIDSTNLTRTVGGSTKPAVAHGLTIQNTIGVSIEFSPSGFTFTIISNGETFEQTYTYASASVRPKYEVEDMTISNVDFGWTCKDFANGIWLYGDSYFSYGTNRWIYYLIENGYADNCLIDGYPGEDSPHALASLRSYISMSKPKYIVWCLGMNDGSDNGAPTTQWLNNVQEFLALCTANNITPVLATIPTVPTINHEYKNAWVRSSGYQYIDFAKAVGADANGDWFDGMLETGTTRVHPTVSGAMALYHRAMTDCPQLYNDI